MRARRIGWTVVLLCGPALWWACRGQSGVPSDLASVAVTRAPEQSGHPAELIWGGWHPVPWDQRVGPILDRAYRLQLQGRREDAIALLNQGLSQLSSSAVLLEARGALYGAMGYRRAAARDFSEACDLQPTRARTWCALGRMRQELGLANEALAALERAADLGLDDPELHLIQARAYRELRRRGRSAGHYAQALEGTPNPPYELLVEAALLYYELDEASPEAVDRALALMALDLPEDPAEEAQMWLVHSLLRDLHDRDAETIASGLSSLEITPRSLRDWTQLSLLAVQLDDPETRAELEGGLALGPGEGR